MKRVIVTGICLVLMSALGACASDEEDSGPTAASERNSDTAQELPDEQVFPDADLDNPTSQLTGPLPDGGAASCVEEYSPSAVAKRAFAFDGVVVDFGPAGSNRPDRGHLELAGVTFAVGEWFSGGGTSMITLDMAPPVEGAQGLPEGVPSYAVGSRLLVSGEPRWGGGSPLKDAIAFGCAFTRYYDSATAESWRRALPRR
ncbi:MAG TPA: hypothetical protein DGG94_07050 [Micromonosporaceae bacterium]|nr:hypothetical protein [Micromonosporaceae bacterium]HCU49544.1 hypothetical protein [Micromonosporaceae bacterium]